MKLLFAAALGFLLSLNTCHAADMKVDGRTKESFDRSVKAMADTLSDADKKVFAEGLMNMILTEYPSAKGMSGIAVLSVAPQALDAAHVTMDGKTLSEIVARGRSVDQQTDAQQGKETAAKSVDEPRRECLRQKVLLSKASIDKQDYGYNIAMEVTNHLDWPIAGIRVSYSATSEGRAVPWIEADFAMELSGGVEPGETRKISTSAFPPANAPSSFVVKAKLLDVSDQNKSLFVRDVRIMGWSDKKSERRCD